MLTLYNDALQTFKSSFRSDTEADVWLAEVTARVAPGELGLLDIGVGDCDSITRRCAALASHSIRVQLTGIDPGLPDSADRVEPAPDSVLIRTGFAEYHPAQAFDVVNATHALYYLGDPAAALRRMVAMTRPGGLIVVTTWGRDCVLRKLFAECFAETPGQVLTAERVRDELLRVGGVEQVDLARSHGEIDLGLWATDGKHLEAAAHVISRSGLSDTVAPQRRERLAAALRQYATVEPRVNGIVLARRSA